MSEKARCCRVLDTNPGPEGPIPITCSLLAKVTREGKHFCNVHDPQGGRIRAAERAYSAAGVALAEGWIESPLLSDDELGQLSHTFRAAKAALARQKGEAT